MTSVLISFKTPLCLVFLHRFPCLRPHRAPPGLSLKFRWHRLRREAVVDEGCERSGHSIDCILALISIWLDPPPLQRSGTGAEVFQLGVQGGPPGADPLWWKQRGGRRGGGGGGAGVFCAERMTLGQYSIQRSGCGPTAERAGWIKRAVCQLAAFTAPRRSVRGGRLWKRPSANASSFWTEQRMARPVDFLSHLKEVEKTVNTRGVKLIWGRSQNVHLTLVRDWNRLNLLNYYYFYYFSSPTTCNLRNDNL